ncbi:MAG: DHA2 family efflux MFS transporter permease subunit [Pseudomonadota bacterium]|nr:DHA2 family efflux MFS transporter permease subunit [Pseudomonadota bacterium]
MFAGMAASFTMVVSGTIVNVAVPSVIGAFGIGLDQAQLITTGFNIAMVTSQLLSAWLVAAFGQRAGFLLMAAVFTLGSVIGGLGQTFDMVVVGRVLQGVAAGVIQPLVMVVAFQVFPADRRGYAMAIYSMGIFLAVAVGPVFGGFAIELLHWRYIFWAPLPIIFTAALMGWVFMPSVPSKERKAFDWVGYILLIVSVYCLVTAITEGNREGWTSSYIVGLFITGITCGIVLVWTQLQSWSSLIDLTLFKNKQFAMVAFIAFVFGFGNFGTGYGVPVFGQLIQGMTPIVAALMMLPSSLLIVAALPFTGKLADRIPAHIGILVGLALFAIGTAPMAGADVNTSFFLIGFYFVVSRMGMSFTNPFIMSAALRTLPPEQLSAGGGMVNFCRQFGGSMGLTAWVAFVQYRTQHHGDALTATQSSDNSTTRELMESVGRVLSEEGLPLEIQSTGALHFLGEVIHAQASTFGFQDGFRLLVVFFLCAMIPAYLLGRIKK